MYDLRPIRAGVCPVLLAMCIDAAFLLHPAAAGEKDNTAIEKLQKRAAQGHIPEQVELAAAYVNGDGVAQDLAKAAHWYEMAAKLGDPEAENQIGYFYLHGIGVSKDDVKAFHWFQLASAGGLGWGKVNLGVSYIHGIGCRKDASLARELFKEAAEQRIGLAASYLGIMHYFGVGVAMDTAAGERWLARGEKLHDPIAAYILAQFYSGANNHPRDLPRAARLLRASSAAGYVAAMHRLGMLLMEHPSLALTQTEAQHSFEQASRAGEWRSSAELSLMPYKQANATGHAAVHRAFYFARLAEMQGGAEAGAVLKRLSRDFPLQLAGDDEVEIAAEAQKWFNAHRVRLMFVYKKGITERNYPMLAGSGPESQDVGRGD